MTPRGVMAHFTHQKDPPTMTVLATLLSRGGAVVKAITITIQIIFR